MLRIYILVLGVVLLFVSCAKIPVPSWEDLENMGDNIQVLSWVYLSETYSWSQRIYEQEIPITTFVYEYNFELDDSYQKYVNPEISFENKMYVPNDLIHISWEFVFDTKGNQFLREEAKQSLDLLSEAFYEKFWVKMKVVSAYRGYTYQKGIKDRGCSDLYCAKAWYSEHQSGLAFDMFEATNEQTFLSKSHLKKYFEWMKEYAHFYGFHNSYQKGREIDGYAIEPWHWRYVGKDFATYLYQEQKTFWEFMKENTFFE